MVFVHSTPSRSRATSVGAKKLSVANILIIIHTRLLSGHALVSCAKGLCAGRRPQRNGGSSFKEKDRYWEQRRMITAPVVAEMYMTLWTFFSFFLLFFSLLLIGKEGTSMASVWKAENSRENSCDCCVNTAWQTSKGEKKCFLRINSEATRSQPKEIFAHFVRFLANFRLPLGSSLICLSSHGTTKEGLAYFWKSIHSQCRSQMSVAAADGLRAALYWRRRRPRKYLNPR